MSNVTGTGTVFNLPNYSGELFTATPLETPFLSMLGGLTGGGKQTDNFEFPTYSDYELPNAKQPAITETASLTAPASQLITRGQETNVTQIFHESIEISYAKQSNGGRLSGVNTAGQSNNVPNEKDWQIAQKLKVIARDVEHTFLNGTFNKATTSDLANKTRGMFELCSKGSTVNAASALLSQNLLNDLLLEMFNAGAVFENPVIFVNGFNKQVLSQIFKSFAPQSRNVGGMNINTIETDFGTMGVVVNKFVPAGSLGVFDMAHVAPVFQPVPGKGNFFYEELAKKGAGDSGQIFGQIGLAHGHAALHGSITNLKTSRG